MPFIFESMTRGRKILTAFSLLISFHCFSQPQSAKIVADKIIAVVGDRIILFSDIKNAIEDSKRRNEPVPDSAQCMLTEQAIISKVLMLQAEKDSLPVTDEEVDAELDQKIRYYINQLGSQEALEETAGKTIYQIKDDARSTVKEQKLAAAMQHKIVDNIKITPTEVKAFFDRIPKDSLPFFESELEIGQIIVFPKASRDLEQYIVNEMNTYKQQLESKKTDFCSLAKSVSEDPGSKDHCGQYQVNRTEKTWDPVFLSTCFRLKEGDISAPVRSKFGYHIIQLLQRNGDEAVVRHILRIPPVTEDEINASSRTLDSVRKQIQAGSISFMAAATKYSDEDTRKFNPIFITAADGSNYVTIDQLDKEMVTLISKMKPGDYSSPSTFTDPQGKKGVRLVYLKSRSEPHRMNMKDDYSKIAQMALDEKKQKALDKWLKEKLPTYYIVVDPQTIKECPRMQRYLTEQKAF